MTVAEDSLSSDIQLPPPAFAIDHTRSDPGRPTRAHRGSYHGPIIDTHVHLPSKSTEAMLPEILAGLREVGVERAVFMATPNEGRRSGDATQPRRRLALRMLDAARIRLLCCAHYLTDWFQRVYERGYGAAEIERTLAQLREDLDSGVYAGVGELGMYHFEKQAGMRVIAYPPNLAPLLAVLAEIAQRRLWLDLHAEPVDPEGKSYEAEVFGGLELLYQRLPNLRVILSHTGMTNVSNARNILRTYPNVMMNINVHLQHEHWRNLEPIVNQRGELYQDWAELFEKMPERFMVGAGKRASNTSVRKHQQEIKRIRALLSSLDPAVAERIAYKNADRLFP